MKPRQALAARLVAPLEQALADEMRPLEEVEEDLQVLGIDPTASIIEAQRLARGGRSVAARWLAGLEDSAPVKRVRRHKEWLSPTAVVLLLRAFDVAVILLAAWTAWIYCADGRAAVLEYPLSVLAVILALNIFQFADLYRFERLTNLFGQTRQLLLAWATVIASLLVIGFMLKVTSPAPPPIPLDHVKFIHATSRSWIGLWFLLGLFGLFVVRLVLSWQIHRWQTDGRLTRRLVVVGGGEHGQFLVEQVLKHGDPGLRIVGIFDDRRSGRVPAAISGLPVLGTVIDLVGFARRSPIDQVIVALPWQAASRMFAWMPALRSLHADVCFCPHFDGLYLPQGPIVDVAGIPMLNVAERPLSGWSSVVKNMENRLVAAAILFVLLPVFLLIALLIKLECRGPVLVRQKRQGLNGEVVEVYQFRTTYVDHQVDGQTGGRDGPRVTSFGRFLRRASLDELPQFINMLLGTKSVVAWAPYAVVRG